MAKLVAFYSRADENYFGGTKKYISEGNTKKAAEKIAELTGADLFEIVQEVPYAADYDTCIAEAKRDLKAKARPKVKNLPESLDAYEGVSLMIIGADTIVAKDNQIMGKPKDHNQAFDMLNLLQNNTHQVYTGVSIILYDFETKEKKVHSFHDCTDVEFYPMTDSEINSYIETGDCYDKAGSYGIQGSFAIHVKGIHGDYNNVVGLPIAKLYHELEEM